MTSRVRQRTKTKELIELNELDTLDDLYEQDELETNNTFRLITMRSKPNFLWLFFVDDVMLLLLLSSVVL